MSDRKSGKANGGFAVTGHEAQQIDALLHEIEDMRAPKAIGAKTDAELVVAGEPTVRQRMHEETLEHQFNRLTEGQQRRVLARLQGRSLGEIATAEGRTKASIRETLEAPAVRNVFTELATVELVYEDGTKGNLLEKMLMVVVDAATSATRPITVAQFGGGECVEHVPDYRTRIDAAARVLALVPKTVAPPRTREAIHERIEVTERLGYREAGA